MCRILDLFGLVCWGGGGVQIRLKIALKSYMAKWRISEFVTPHEKFEFSSVYECVKKKLKILSKKLY